MAIKKYDLEKVKKMAKHSLKSLWILSRIKLLQIIIVSCGVYYAIATAIESMNVGDSVGAFALTFIAGMFFMGLLNFIGSVFRVVIERIKWLIENKELMFKTRILKVSK